LILTPVNRFLDSGQLIQLPPLIAMLVGLPKGLPFGAQTQTGSHPLPNATDESVSKGIKLFFGAVP
jgi:hypothetical protein